MDAELYDVALQLIEREIGRSVRTVVTTETINVNASFAQLKHRPIQSIISVKARKKQWEHSDIFGQMPMTDIPLDEVEVTPTGIVLPLTVWGSYDEATVKYVYGFDAVPSEIERAVSILVEQMEQSGGSMYTAQTVLLSEEITELLRPYRS